VAVTHDLDWNGFPARDASCQTVWIVENHLSCHGGEVGAHSDACQAEECRRQSEEDGRVTEPPRGLREALAAIGIVYDQGCKVYKCTREKGALFDVGQSKEYSNERPLTITAAALACATSAANI
jgi:hypothetical protein